MKSKYKIILETNYSLVIVIYGLIVHRVGTSGRNSQRTNLEMVKILKSK